MEVKFYDTVNDELLKLPEHSHMVVVGEERFMIRK